MDQESRLRVTNMTPLENEKESLQIAIRPVHVTYKRYFTNTQKNLWTDPVYKICSVLPIIRLS